MKIEFAFLIILLLYISLYNCQSDLQAKQDDADIEINTLDEWQRYIKFNRQLMLDMKKKKKRRSTEKKSITENKLVAPSFMLSRTKSGLIVKQQEPGSQSHSKGGFEIPSEPIFLTYVQYKHDGAISPVIKLIETKKGIVGKKLEYGKSKTTGINWASRSGAANFKGFGRSGERIDNNGVINKEAGLNKKYSDGTISVRGIVKQTLTRTPNINSFNPIEPLPDDETNDNEMTYYTDSDKAFEKEDVFYDNTGVSEGGQYTENANKYDSNDDE